MVHRSRGEKGGFIFEFGEPCLGRNVYILYILYSCLRYIASCNNVSQTCIDNMDSTSNLEYLQGYEH